LLSGRTRPVLPLWPDHRGCGLGGGGYKYQGDLNAWNFLLSFSITIQDKYRHPDKIAQVKDVDISNGASQASDAGITAGYTVGYASISSK
jgi:hypothetical protein